MKCYLYRFLIGMSVFLFSCEAKTTQKEIRREVDVMMPAPTADRKQYLLDSAGGYYRQWISRGNFSGQYLIAKNGHIIYSRAAGFSNAEAQIKMTLETPIHVASISKVATALAVLRLVDQGKIALNQKVTHYLPKFPYKEITVNMLLSHRSGLPYYGYFADAHTDRKTLLNNADIIRLMIQFNIRLNSKPGTHFAYCNTNYAMLALIVEKVTKLPFPKAMRALIFDPLDMESSIIAASKAQYDEFCRNYNQNGMWNGFTYLDAIYGDKNLYTTARDLVKLDRGTYLSVFLSDSLRKQMFRGYSYEHPGTRNYGLGIRLKEKKGKDTFFFHTGWWHGNTGLYCSLRQDTICIIALSNNMNKRVYNLGPLIKACGNYVVNDEE
jgi:CubicO group peptidase (beta-lactamase class C family)